MTTVQGLLVFFGFGLETTISSNMNLPPTGGSQTSGDVFASTGFVAGCGSGACCNTTAAPMIPRNHERRGDSKTGVRSTHNPHQPRKGESTIVSFIEYPTKVSRAAMTVKEISKCSSEKNPSVIKTS